MRASNSQLTRLPLKGLSLSYDAATTSVLVLSLQQPWAWRAYTRPCKLRAHYCNGAAATLFGLGAAEPDLKSSALEIAVLDVLEVTEPALVCDIAAQLKRIGNSDPGSELTIQITALKYLQRQPSSASPSSTPSGGHFRGPAFTSSPSPVPKDDRQQAARRWHKVVLEPVMLVSDASDDVSVGARSAESPSASNRRLSKLWRIATCCGVSNQQSHAAWPAVVVTVRGSVPDHAKSCAGFCMGADSLSDETSVAAGLVARASHACIDAPVSRNPQNVSSGQQSTCPPTVDLPSSAKVHVVTEQMVLSALTPIITAVTPDGRGVVYQNGLSVTYFGRRIKPQSPPGQQQELAVEERPDAVQVLVEYEGQDASGDVLAELFSLEPEKMERMMTEVCRHGQVWRGIVQVPQSYNSQPGREPPTHFLSAGITKDSSPIGARHHQGYQLLRAARSTRGSEPPATKLSSACLALEPAAATCAEVDTDTAQWSRLSTAATIHVQEDCMQMAHQIEGLRQLSFAADDPLATSTWGLLMAGVSEPARGPGSANNFGSPICRASRSAIFPHILASDGTSSAAGEKQPQGRQSEQEEPAAQQHTVDDQRGKLTSIPTGQAMTGNELQTNNTPLRNIPSSLLRVPRVPSASAHVRSPLALYARRSSDIPVVVSRKTAVAMAIPSSQGGQEGEEEPLKGLLVSRAASMTTQRPWQCGTSVNSTGSGNLVRRCISRQDLTGSGHSQSRTTARVMAFASSLRITPPVVQQVLQQAVADAASTGGWRTSTGILGSRTVEEIQIIGRSDGGGVKDNEVLLTLLPISPECSSRVTAAAAEGSAAVSSRSRVLRPPSKRIPASELAAPSSTCSELGSFPTPMTLPSLGQTQTAATRLSVSTLFRSETCNSPSRQDLPIVPCGKEANSNRRSRTNSLVTVGVFDRNPSSAMKSQGGPKATVNAMAAARASRNKKRTTDPPNSSFPPLTTIDLEQETVSCASNCVHACSSEHVGDAEPVSLPSCKQSWQPSVVVASGASPCWHEVAASRAVDPRTGQLIIVVAQTDVTAKVEAERHLALLTEAEHRLLEQIFPRHVLACLTEEGGPLLQLAAKGTATLSGPSPSTAQGVPRDINRLATSHAEVTLLFADIQGFTPMCKQLEPRVVMTFLNDLFTRFDRQLDEFGVYKVETIGDCYFVAGGLVHEDEDGMAAVRTRKSHADPVHAEKVYMFAKAMLSAASEVRLPTTGGPVRVRIGIHTGPVVSGLVGERMPRFCLFGDTVNTASRMESTGVPGCMHVSEATWRQLPKEGWTSTGGIEVKGKGFMNTYLWAPPDTESQALLANHITESAAARSNAGRGVS